MNNGEVLICEAHVRNYILKRSAVLRLGWPCRWTLSNDNNNDFIDAFASQGILIDDWEDTDGGGVQDESNTTNKIDLVYLFSLWTLPGSEKLLDELNDASCISVKHAVLKK